MSKPKLMLILQRAAESLGYPPESAQYKAYVTGVINTLKGKNSGRK